MHNVHNKYLYIHVGSLVPNPYGGEGEKDARRMYSRGGQEDMTYEKAPCGTAVSLCRAARGLVKHGIATKQSRELRDILLYEAKYHHSNR